MIYFVTKKSHYSFAFTGKRNFSAMVCNHRLNLFKKALVMFSIVFYILFSPLHILVEKSEFKVHEISSCVYFLISFVDIFETTITIMVS